MKLCDYCNEPTQFVDSKIIYGTSYGMVYYCEPCKAWVGVHKGTDKPLGRLANEKLRSWKKQAHFWFDKSWRGKYGKRKAYNQLSRRMGIPKKEAHIDMFDVDKCKKVVEIYRTKTRPYQGHFMKLTSVIQICPYCGKVDVYENDGHCCIEHNNYYSTITDE